MATPVSPDILNRETDARFAAQSGLVRKLEPNNPTDSAFIKVWKDIYAKVKREADTGTLITTFDHPAVVQDLSDAAVAHKAAAAHLDIAASAPDAATAQANIDAATTAQQISRQKAREAASKQPPTVSPQLVQEASKEVAKNPPPPQAPASEHIAHEHAHKHAHAHAQEVHAQAQAQVPQPQPVTRDAIYAETDRRFWLTGYKPGHKLDMSIPEDREKAKIWAQILQQVQNEASAGTLVIVAPPPMTGPVLSPSEVPPGPVVSPSDIVRVPEVPPPPPPPSMPPPSQAGPASPRPWFPSPMQPGMQPPPGWRQPLPSPGWRPPMTPQPGMQPSMPPGPRPEHRREHREHRRGEGRSRPDLQQPPPGMPGPNGVPPSPPGTPGSTDSGGPPSGPPTDVAPTGEGAPPSSGLSGGKIALIVLGLGGTLLYMGAKHKSAPPPRARSPKVIVATPARAIVGRAAAGAASDE